MVRMKLLVCHKKKAEDIMSLHLCPSREQLYFLYIAISGQLVLCCGGLDEFGNHFIHRPFYPSDKEIRYKGLTFSHYEWNMYMEELKRANVLINP